MNTQYLPVSAGTLAYDDQGSGPLVLCVPSMGDVRQEYRFRNSINFGEYCLSAKGDLLVSSLTGAPRGVWPPRPLAPEVIQPVR